MFRFDHIGELAGAIPLTTADLITKPLALTLVAVFIIACLPNTQQFMGRYTPVIHWNAWRKIAPPVISLTWRPTLGLGTGDGGCHLLRPRLRHTRAERIHLLQFLGTRAA